MTKKTRRKEMDNVIDTKKGYRLITLKKMIAAAALVTLCGASVVMAGDLGPQQNKSRDPLIEILIRKGVLSPQEADQIQQEAKALEEQKQERMTEEVKDSVVPEALKGLKVEVLGYADYSAGESGKAGNLQDSYNKFRLTRGYLTVEKAIQPWIGARLTTDIHQDSDGSWLTRVKYLYASLKPHDLGLLTGMKAEIGQGHIPWLDFEEHVNPYRCQGTMAIERAGVFNSADLGVSLQGSFGGKLAEAKKLTGNSHYDGRYGTWHAGIYNGGGYHAAENNDNKVLEGRLTVRPLPDSFPGLQLSYLGLYGDGNTVTYGNSPDYRVNLGMISYEHPSFILTGQYFATKGNAGGSWVDANKQALDTTAYSFFGNYRLPVLENKLSAFGRYDHFDGDDNNDMGIAGEDATYDLFIGGLAYDLYKGNMVLLTYETTSYGKDSGGMGKVPSSGNNLGDDKKIQVVYQLKF
jgi:hypothetical protein